jgi:hypothetical protein
MKKLTSIMAILFLTLFFGCSNEQLDEQNSEKTKIKNQTIEISDEFPDTDNGEHCVYTHLIAGQHHTAGSVTIDVVGDNLIVTYTTNADWTIGTTHLSIGVCDEDWVPTTGSGNPQIGQFEFTEPYSQTDQEVIYIIPITDVGDNYCFAAHAEVEGPTGGETAWAEGAEFSGNSWAMFSEFDLSNCTSNDDDGENGPV